MAKRYAPQTITRIRENLSMTKQAFADRIGIHRNVLNDWESGKTRPSMTSLEAIMVAFSLNDANIFFVDDITYMQDA